MWDNLPAVVPTFYDLAVKCLETGRVTLLRLYCVVTGHSLFAIERTKPIAPGRKYRRLEIVVLDVLDRSEGGFRQGLFRFDPKVVAQKLGLNVSTDLVALTQLQESRLKYDEIIDQVALFSKKPATFEDPECLQYFLTVLQLCISGAEEQTSLLHCDWESLGFQRKSNPCSDFRALGKLGLMQIAYFAQHQEKLLPEWPGDLPCALTLLNVCGFAVSLLRKGDLRHHFDSCCEHPTLEDFLKATAHLSALTAKYWIEKTSRNVMLFETDFKLLKVAVRRFLTCENMSLIDAHLDQVLSA